MNVGRSSNYIDVFTKDGLFREFKIGTTDIWLYLVLILFLGEIFALEMYQVRILTKPKLLFLYNYIYITNNYKFTNTINLQIYKYIEFTNNYIYITYNM